MRTTINRFAVAIAIVVLSIASVPTIQAGTRATVRQHQQEPGQQQTPDDGVVSKVIRRIRRLIGITNDDPSIIVSVPKP